MKKQLLFPFIPLFIITFLMTGCEKTKSVDKEKNQVEKSVTEEKAPSTETIAETEEAEIIDDKKRGVTTRDTPVVLPPMTGAEKMVKAKVWVEIVQMGKGTDNIRKARAINNLTGDEMLTVVVNPEKDSFVYIINSNEQESVLLNRSPEEQFVKKAEKRVFPNVGQLYKVDTTKDKESLTLVVSPNEHTEIKKLFASGTAPQEQWGPLEEELVQTSSLLAKDELEKRIIFGGQVKAGVRVLEPPAIKHRTAAGKGLIIKKYQFNVKN